MKGNHVKLWTAGIALLLIAAAAVSQTVKRTDFHRGEMRGGPGLPFFALQDLTDAQKTQIRQLFDSSRATVKPLWEQEMQVHQAMTQLITSGTFDEGKAQVIANQAAQVHGQLELQHARVESQAYQVLTAQQKSELNEIMARHQQRMQQWRSEHQAPPPDQAPNE